jgi:hypothetical protein
MFRNHPSFQGALAFDEFSMRTVSKKPLPWKKEGSAWSDTDDSLAAEWLQHEQILVNSNVAAEAIFLEVTQ